MKPATPFLGTPMLIWSLTGEAPLRINAAFEQLTGLTLQELSKQPLSHWVHPEDLPSLQGTLGATDQPVSARFKGRGDLWVALEWKFGALGDEHYLLGSQSSHCLNPAPSPEPKSQPTDPNLASTLNAMALIVEAKNPNMLCSILMVDSKCEYIVGGAGPSLPEAYNKSVEGLRIGPDVGSCGTAAFWNTTVIVEDIAKDPLWKDLRAAAALAGVASCWSCPVTSIDGKVLGAMALYNRVPASPKEHHINSLEIAARMVGLAIGHHRLEAQLGQNAKMEALGILAGGIAHDFNNMLAAVLGNAELALEQLPADGSPRKNLEEIITASMNATELCNQMLAYAGRGASTPEPVECNALLRELGGLLKVAISKKVSLNFELNPAPLGITADRSQIRQVMLNLITNASEAIGNQSGQITLSTHAFTCCETGSDEQRPVHRLSAGRHAVICVSDTGRGMSADLQEQIFDPFFTTKSAGRGLGLAAVQGIINAHKGVITIESQAGKGTTFSVYLPLLEAPCEAPHSDHKPDRPGMGACVLVADDEPQVRKVLTAILEQAGYNVICASNGREAVELYSSEPDKVDCVLLDLSMPELDGDEVFHELQSIRSDVRVVLSSGFTEQQIMDRFHDRGLAGVVQKPASMHVLLAKISEAIRGSSSEPSLR